MTKGLGKNSEAGFLFLARNEEPVDEHVLPYRRITRFLTKVDDVFSLHHFCLCVNMMAL